MKIKKFNEEFNIEDHNYDSFKKKITKEHVKYYKELQERITLLAFMIYEKENDEEFDAEGRVNWDESEMFVNDILTEDNLILELLSGNEQTSVVIPTILIFEPDKFEEYYASKKYNL